MEIHQMNSNLTPIAQQQDHLPINDISISEYQYNKNDTFLILIKKNDRLYKLLTQANAQLEDLSTKYAQLESKSQKDKAAILKQLDQIASSYKTYAESHKILQLAEQKAKELLDNNITLAHRVSLLTSTNNSTQNLLNDLYQMLMNHTIEPNNSGKFIELLRSFMNEKFKAIREEIAIKDIDPNQSNSNNHIKNKEGLLLKANHKKKMSNGSSPNDKLNQSNTTIVHSRKYSPSNQMIYVKCNTRPITPNRGIPNSNNDKKEINSYCSIKPTLSKDKLRTLKYRK